MKAVLAEIPADWAKHRKLTGADRYDEMWEGVLHVPPMPNRYHQDLIWALETFLRQVWKPTQNGRVYHDVNVTPVDGCPHNYRAPDLIILLPERFAIDHNEYFEGAPSVVVEIHSPGDEAYEKLEFYADLGVLEVWIIDRDSGVPDLYQLKKNRYKKKPVSADGWLRSSETGVELRQGTGNKLAIRLAGDETSRQDLPPE